VKERVRAVSRRKDDAKSSVLSEGLGSKVVALPYAECVEAIRLLDQVPARQIGHDASKVPCPLSRRVASFSRTAGRMASGAPPRISCMPA
jgi:hypothetical protein